MAKADRSILTGAISSTKQLLSLQPLSHSNGLRLASLTSVNQLSKGKSRPMKLKSNKGKSFHYLYSKAIILTKQNLEAPFSNPKTILLKMDHHTRTVERISPCQRTTKILKLLLTRQIFRPFLLKESRSLERKSNRRSRYFKARGQRLRCN